MAGTNPLQGSALISNTQRYVLKSSPAAAALPKLLFLQIPAHRIHFLPLPRSPAPSLCPVVSIACCSLCLMVSALVSGSSAIPGLFSAGPQLQQGSRAQRCSMGGIALGAQLPVLYVRHKTSDCSELLLQETHQRPRAASGSLCLRKPLRAHSCCLDEVTTMRDNPLTVCAQSGVWRGLQGID